MYWAERALLGVPQLFQNSPAKIFDLQPLAVNIRMESINIPRNEVNIFEGNLLRKKLAHIGTWDGLTALARNG